MRLGLKLAACLLVAACRVAEARAGPLVISVNFASEKGGTALSGSDAAGFIPAINWNNLSGSSGSNSTLVGNDGTTSGGTVSWSGPDDDWNTSGVHIRPIKARHSKDDVSATSMPEAAVTLTVPFSGLPAVIGPILRRLRVRRWGGGGTSGATTTADSVITRSADKNLGHARFQHFGLLDGR